MKLTITGDAYVLTSEIKVDDILLLKKYNPDALAIRDAETKKTLFAVSYAEGRPCVAEFGVTFGGKTRDESGYATITGAIPATIKTADAAKDYVAETFGGVIAYLKTLEGSIKTAAKEISETRKTLVDSITVA